MTVVDASALPHPVEEDRLGNHVVAYACGGGVDVPDPVLRPVTEFRGQGAVGVREVDLSTGHRG